MAFVFNKVLNANNFEPDSFAVSNLWQTGADEISFAYEQVTSLGADDTTKRIYTRKYTISSGALSAEVGVSGADAGTPVEGFWKPSFAGNADGSVRVIGYSRGGEFSPFTGFVVRESTDSGATWGSAWTGGGSYDTDSLVGVFRDFITGDIYAVTQSGTVGGYNINVHKRTGAGTWTSHLANTGTSTNNYNYLYGSSPSQNCLFVNGVALIVGSKNTGSVYALRSTDLTAWTEIPIFSFSDHHVRYCKLAYATDNVARLMVPHFDITGIPGPPVIAFSGNMGTTWTNIGQPPGLFMEDQNGNAVVWPYTDYVSFILDGRARMYLLVPDIGNGCVQTFRAWSTKNTSWGLVGTDVIVDGSSNTYDPNNASNFPSSAIAVSGDIFRVVSSFLSGGPYVQAWMIKNAGGAIAAGGRTGGGGKPRSYTAGD